MRSGNSAIFIGSYSLGAGGGCAIPQARKFGGMAIVVFNSVFARKRSVTAPSSLSKMALFYRKNSTEFLGGRWVD